MTLNLSRGLALAALALSLTVASSARAQCGVTSSTADTFRTVISTFDPIAAPGIDEEVSFLMISVHNPDPFTSVSAVFQTRSQTTFENDNCGAHASGPVEKCFASRVILPGETQVVNLQLGPNSGFQANVVNVVVWSASGGQWFVPVVSGELLSKSISDNLTRYYDHIDFRRDGCR